MIAGGRPSGIADDGDLRITTQDPRAVLSARTGDIGTGGGLVVFAVAVFAFGSVVR